MGLRLFNFLLFVSLLTAMSADIVVFNHFVKTEKANMIAYRMAQPLYADSRDYPPYESHPDLLTTTILVIFTLIAGLLAGALFHSSQLFRDVVLAFLAFTLILQTLRMVVGYIKRIE